MVKFLMKIAVSGKGGVGKTTLSAALSHIFAKEGRRVLAVDADPDANLASAFGLKAEDLKDLHPIAEMADLVEERTGARPGAPGGVYRLNPKVDDIAERFGHTFDGITLVVTGKSKEAASGCYCPENVLLRRLLKHIIVERDEVVIIDMEAGIEHLTRGTAEAVDAFIVVVEPGRRSIQTAVVVKRMAEGLGVKNVFVVANKVRGTEDIEFIKNALGDLPLAGVISYNPKVIEADIKGSAPFDDALLREVSKIRDALRHPVG